MTEVFTHPEELNEFFPKTNFWDDVQKYMKEEENFIKKVQEYCKKHSKSKYAGEIFKVPMGDGNAMYVVASLRPLQVIHLKVGDEWDSGDVRYYTADHIKQKVDSQKALDRLFSK